LLYSSWGIFLKRQISPKNNGNNKQNKIKAPGRLAGLDWSLFIRLACFILAGFEDVLRQQQFPF